MQIGASEPQPPDPSWPRYSPRPFPAYRFVPGRSPHPHRNPQGHSFGRVEAKPALLPPEQWRRVDDYLYAIDLYNYAYWWECHEVLEGLWRAAGQTTEQGMFFRALIQLAAANLKRFVGQLHATDRLLRRGLLRLERVSEHYMGIDVVNLRNQLEEFQFRSAPLIRLNW